MNYVVVSYYTIGTLYEKQAQRLLASVRKFNIPHDIQGVANLGSWDKNTRYKPTFLRRMLHLHHPQSIVWIDCDAEFVEYPTLFDVYDAEIGVYVFDRSEYRVSDKGKEVLSGTIWLKNTPKVIETVERWEAECQSHPGIWDQKSLEKVLAGKFSLLPAEYCKIFDRMKFVKRPVIVHHQTSRIVRQRGGKLA
jgi:hypothetical protein